MSIFFGSKFRFISVVVFGCVQSLSVPECRTDLVSSLVFLPSIFCPFCIVVFSVYFCFKFIFINSLFAVLWFQVNRRIQTSLKKYWSVNYKNIHCFCILIPLKFDHIWSCGAKFEFL